MGTVAFVYAAGLSEYALEKPLETGEIAFSRVVEAAEKLPHVEKVVLLTDRNPEDFSEHWNKNQGPIKRADYYRTSDVIASMREEVEEDQNLFFLWGDMPLIDLHLAEAMYDRHVRYFASYTFADGYPLGLTPEIFRGETLARVEELAERNELLPSRTMFFDAVQKDINAFDLETEVAPKDMRLYRVTLAADTRRNYLLLNKVIEKAQRAGGTTGGEGLYTTGLYTNGERSTESLAEKVMRVIEEHREVLRTLPAYMQVQVNAACPQSCSYCPYPYVAGGSGVSFSGTEDYSEETRENDAKAVDVTSLEGEMSVDRWKSLLDDAEAFCDDLVVGIGLWGEPALHGHIAELVEIALSHPKFRVLIETSGVGWSAEAIKQIGELDTERIDWIVSLDAATEETYRSLRGPGRDEAQASISMLRNLFPEKKVHVQAVRIHENEAELEQFYRRWKEEEVPLIIQKYDHFCGFLTERKVTDLSPLNRFPCRHLKRDLTVLLDGTVRMCREDLDGTYHIGNIFEEGIESVWNRIEPYYLRHISEDLPSLCESCDEYYTFNF